MLLAAEAVQLVSQRAQEELGSTPGLVMGALSIVFGIALIATLRGKNLRETSHHERLRIASAAGAVVIGILLIVIILLRDFGTIGV